jgi:V/A-type H+-transporting ATPase subunit F
MYKIGIIGDRDSVLGFLAVGFSVEIADDSKQAALCLKKMAEDNFAVIYITEELASQITDEIDKYKDDMTPAIVLLPSKDGGVGLGMRNIKKSVERAIGADILFKNND